jgi:hypothetical protein
LKTTLLVALSFLADSGDPRAVRGRGRRRGGRQPFWRITLPLPARHPGRLLIRTLTRPVFDVLRLLRLAPRHADDGHLHAEHDRRRFDVGCKAVSVAIFIIALFVVIYTTFVRVQQQ